MKTKSFARIATLFLIVGLLSACAAKGRTVVITDEGQVTPGKTVHLRVRSGPNVVRKDFVEVSREFHETLSNRLLEDRIFTAVVDPGDPADYEMVASLEHLVVRGYASGGQRDGQVHVNVTLVDTATGKEIKSLRVIAVGPRVAGNVYTGKTVDPSLAINIAVEHITIALGGPKGPFT